MALTDFIEQDFGDIIRITVTEDDSAHNISSYTTLQIILKAPDGRKISRTASFFTDGTDGIIECTLADGDFDQDGDWRLQARVAKTGVDICTESVTFSVGEKL